jgi:hypothetical protein
MSPLRRWLALAVPVAISTLAMGCAPAASSPSAATPHAKDAAATAPHLGAVHIVHRGLARDCVYIQFGFQTDVYIKGGGVNKPVTLSNQPNCFDLLNKFSVPFGTTSYTGYEYQNGDGHCLWDNGGTIDVGAACKLGHPNEEFFGLDYAPDVGWQVSVVAADNPDIQMGSTNCQLGNPVVIPGNCGGWEFPPS